MTSASNFTEQGINNALRNNASFIVTQTYVFLHTGDPGEDGNLNFAAEDTGKLVTWNAPHATNGSMTSSNTQSWASVAATETYTHISLRDAATTNSGNCIAKGPLASAVPVNQGNAFEFPAGSITIVVD